MMRLTLRTATVGVAVVAIGIAGVASIPPARAAIVDAMSCALSAPCIEWDNSSSGDAVKGVSTKGSGLHGQTKFKSAGKTSGHAGVLGEDLSTSGNLDSGVSGVSTNGAGVTGTSTGWNGVEGLTVGAGTSGVYGQNGAASGYGVAGRNTATTHDNNGAGVLADGGSNDDGLHAFASGANANAIYSSSQAGSAIVASQGPNDGLPTLLLNHTAGPTNNIIQAAGPSGVVFAVSSGGAAFVSGNLSVGQVSDAGALGALGHISGGGGLDVSNGDVTFSVPSGASKVLDLDTGTAGTVSGVLNIFDSNDTEVFTATDTGDMFIDGLIHTHGSCNAGCVVGGKRIHNIDEYASMEAEPTIEDNGEATLVDGVANVAMDPKFVNVIDPASEYLVSVTPEGDCEGLYVASRGPNGFVVRELRRGHHSLSFEYRIVAKRTGVDAPRLPMTDVTRMVPRPRARTRG